jgi:hypothetical protein
LNCAVEGTPSDVELQRQETAPDNGNLPSSTEEQHYAPLDDYDDHSYTPLKLRPNTSVRLSAIRKAVKSASESSLKKAVVGIVNVLQKTIDQEETAENAQRETIDDEVYDDCAGSTYLICRLRCLPLLS